MHACRSLEAAVEAAAKFLNKAAKPVLVGGVKLRPLRAEKEFVELADACGTLSLRILGQTFSKKQDFGLGWNDSNNVTERLLLASGYPVAVQPHAKGMFPESHERFIGTGIRSLLSPLTAV